MSSILVPGTPLDLPGNEPFFSITNRAAHIQDSLDLLNGKFYRVRVFSPVTAVIRLLRASLDSGAVF